MRDIVAAQRVVAALRQMPAVRHVHPSDANFILVVVDDALRVYKTLADVHGVVVRYRGDEVALELP